MNNTLILIAILLVVLIYFLSQIPRKPIVVHKHPYRSDVIYVKQPIWRLPTGWARPIRRRINHVPMHHTHPSQHLIGPGGTQHLLGPGGIRRFF